MACIQGSTRNEDILTFWNHYWGKIYKLCALKIKDPSSIQDVMQEVYIRLHSHYEDLCCYDNPMLWFRAVVSNLCVDEYRRRNRTQTASECFYHYTVKRNNSLASEADSSRILEGLLNKLSPQMGTLVELHYLHGFPITELSEMFGTNRACLSKRLGSSLKYLRIKACEREKPS